MSHELLIGLWLGSPRIYSVSLRTSILFIDRCLHDRMLINSIYFTSKFHVLYAPYFPDGPIGPWICPYFQQEDYLYIRNCTSCECILKYSGYYTCKIYVDLSLYILYFLIILLCYISVIFIFYSNLSLINSNFLTNNHYNCILHFIPV